MATIDYAPDEFGGYSDFNDVLNPTLRAWNRLNIIFNMKEILHNDGMAVRYMKEFNRVDQLSIWSLAVKIIQNGYENTRREIMRNNNG